MRILNVDDNAIKSAKISAEVKRVDRNADIEWARIGLSALFGE